MFIPKGLALANSQMHAKASASARPSMMEQQVLEFATLRFAKLFNTLAQAFKLGQDNGGGAWAEVRVVKKMLRERMRKVMDALLFEPILK
jgi:hypothetical protein